MKREEQLKSINYLRRKNYLQRERISRLLQPAPGYKYIAVVADSGYGKTRAVLDYMEETEAETIWINLTAMDNYTTHFWNNMTETVANINVHAAGVLRQSGYPDNAQRVHSLREKLSFVMNGGKSYNIVFDDFHNITNNSVIEVMQIFMEISQISVYILSRLRTEFFSKSEAAQIVTGRDLAFTVEEIETYFQRKNSILPYDMLREIHAQTGGWPFSIYLISLAMERNENLLNQAFHFSNTLIFDTIDREIFSTYSEREQNFIVRMSLVNPLPVQMVEDLYGPDVDELIQSKIAQNIFIRYSPDGTFFLCHQLFREFLESRQAELTSEEVEVFCEAAGEWFRRQGRVVEALDCYNRAKSYDVLWEVIWNMLPDHFPSVSAKRLIGILEDFPEDFRQKNPLMRLAEATLYSAMGNMEMEEYISFMLIHELQDRMDIQVNREAVGEAYINLGFCSMKKANTDFVKYFKMAAEYLTEKSQLYRRGFLYLLNGAPLSLKNGDEGEAEAWITALEQAEPDYMNILDGGMAGMAAAAKAMYTYYRGDMQQAEAHALLAIYKAREYDQTDIVCWANFLLVQIAAFKGDYELIMEILERMESYAKQQKAIPQMSVADVSYGSFYSKIGVNECIPGWILDDKMDIEQSSLHAIGIERIVKANAMMNEGRYLEMVPLLQQTIERYERFNMYIYAVYARIQLSIACYYIDDMEQSAYHFCEVYELTHKNELTMMYSTFGKYSRSMLTGMLKLKRAAEGLSPQTAGMLCEVPDEWIRMVMAKASTFAKRVSLIRERYLSDHPEMRPEQEVLTEREKQILTAICEGLTREEISDNMNISINTVKSTLSSVYAKLGAINNAHAVRIAMLRGLI